MTDDIHEVLDKLRHLVDGPDKIEVLSKAEISSLRRVIRMVEMLESWGKLGKGVFWLLSLVAGGLIAWEAILSRVGKW